MLALCSVFVFENVKKEINKKKKRVEEKNEQGWRKLNKNERRESAALKNSIKAVMTSSKQNFQNLRKGSSQNFVKT